MIIDGRRPSPSGLLGVLTAAAAPLTFVLALAFISNSIVSVQATKYPCNETAACQKIMTGSACTDEGYCTNPFTKGCLNAVLGSAAYPKMRTCNSDDGPDAHLTGVDGLCAPTPLDYEEVRIAPNNWESAMFYGWILQILLSEVMDVPATVDTGPGGGDLNFYDPKNDFAFPKKANHFDALYKANEVGDCRDVRGESCAHFITEMWQGKRVLNESAVEREGNGMVGHVGWFIPKFVAEMDASLTHFLGMGGEANREK